MGQRRTGKGVFEMDRGVEKVTFDKYERKRILDAVRGLRPIHIPVGHPTRSEAYHLMKRLEQWVREA